MKFLENRKPLWKEAKKEKNVEGLSGRVKEDQVLVSSKEEAKGIWKRHFELLMNGKTVVGSSNYEHGYGSRWKQYVWAERNRESRGRESNGQD